MAEYKTPQQVLAEYQARMGEELGLQFHRLQHEVLWIHLILTEFVSLFAARLAVVELMNAVAPGFFRVIEDMCWDDVLLRLARLTDEPRTTLRETLTIKRLPSLIVDEHRKEVRQLVDDCAVRCKFAREQRHRKLAHLDLRDVTGRAVVPLPVATLEEMRLATDSLANLLNRVLVLYGGSALSYREQWKLPGGPTAMLRVLKEGADARNRRYERLRQGDFSAATEPEI